MTIWSLSLSSKQEGILKSHLLHTDGCERVAYLLCRTAEVLCDPWDGQTHKKLLVRKVIPIPDSELIKSTPHRVTWSAESFVRILEEAEQTNQIVAVVHNHSAECPYFSIQDDTNESDLLQTAINRNGEGTLLLSVILTSDEKFIGRVWQNPSETGNSPLAMIRSFGSRFHFHYPERGEGMNLREFNRQALAFGETLNQDLRKLRIGIIGCGGTGSATAMLLARLGVGQIALVDKDIVDITNLNRLHGARKTDADAMRSKAEVVARSISDMGLGVRVSPIKSWVHEECCQDILKSCDILFCCTDDHFGRSLINRFAYYYMTPVIDIGLAPIDVDDTGIPKIKTLAGRVAVLIPGTTCLMCREALNPEIIADQALKLQNPTEYERRKAEAYVHDEGNPSPAVITFTTELACVGVNEMIHRLQGFRDVDTDNHVRKFNSDEDFYPEKEPLDYCEACGNEKNWGIGDTDPFLEIVP